jgi:predicted ABC-type transport system involved in lysophospholipase L1 biosynthesis ATPase subunit
VKFQWLAVAGWYHAALLAAAVWVAPRWPFLVPAAVAGALVVVPLLRRSRAAEPWAALSVSLSAVVFLAASGGWRVALGWVLFAGLVCAVALTKNAPRLLEIGAAPLLALVGWAAAFLLAPQLMDFSQGGWLAPAVLLVSSVRLGSPLGPGGRLGRCPLLAPPSREVRGTLSLERAVVAGRDGLPASVPLDLELRAGESLAVICDDPADADLLAAMLAGRSQPRSGEVAVDGAPLVPDDRLVAVVAPGERFINGDLDVNLGVLSASPLSRTDLAAVCEACDLIEIRGEMLDARLEADGEPLDPHQRLLVLAGRVMPSSYRLLVVVDPVPWVDSIRAEQWRSAVVRASVGRTAIWITPDRELASWASRNLVFRHGALRPNHDR